MSREVLLTNVKIFRWDHEWVFIVFRSCLFRFSSRKQVAFLSCQMCSFWLIAYLLLWDQGSDPVITVSWPVCEEPVCVKAIWSSWLWGPVVLATSQLMAWQPGMLVPGDFHCAPLMVNKGAGFHQKLWKKEWWFAFWKCWIYCSGFCNANIEKHVLSWTL